MGGPNGSSDLAELRAALADARRAGEPFDAAWTTVTADYRGLDRYTMEDTRAAWQRAYERLPASAGDRAARRLAVMFDRAP